MRQTFSIETESIRLKMPQLKKSTLVVLVVALLLCILLIVPGQILESYSAPYPTYSHGWPYAFLERTLDNEPTIYCATTGVLFTPVINWTTLNPSDEAPWKSWESWQLWHAEETTWYPLHLVFDFLIGLAMVTIVASLWEYRVRRRGNALRFRLTDFLLLTCLVAVPLAWLQYHAREYAAEEQVLDALSKYDQLYFYDRNIAPLWLKRLWGEGALPEYFWRASEISIEEDHIEQIGELQPLLMRLSHLDTIYLDAVPPDIGKLISIFADLHQLRTLELGSYMAGDPEARCLNESDALHFSKLTQLQEICVYSEESVDEAFIEVIRSRLPNCRITYW